MQINELDTIAVEEEFGNIIEAIAKSTDEQALRDLQSLIEMRLVELSRNEPDGKPLYSC